MSTEPTLLPEKVCFKCGQSKPRSDFYKHPQMADGLLGKCKECTKTDVQKNYQDKHEQYRAYDKKRTATPKRKAHFQENLKRHRQRNPEKDKARRAVAYAVRTGKLLRLPCQVCGNTKSQAHHHDYSKPLDVEWMCFACHRREHGQRVAGDPPKETP